MPPLVLMFVVLYFVMIRPQMKRQKEHKAMIEAVAKGDEIVTAGGLIGKISKLVTPSSTWKSPTVSSCKSSAAPSRRCCPRAPSSKPQPVPSCRRRQQGLFRMNRYPLWKYAMLVIALLIGILYTLPNLFGEAPAVQVSSSKVTVKVDPALVTRVEGVFKARPASRRTSCSLDGNSIKARFPDTDVQLKAKDAISKALNTDPADPTYIVALNLLSRSPQWLSSLHAFPMYLGLDLRGGVHFLMQVDMKSALTKKAESLTGDARTMLREKNIRHAGISREGNVSLPSPVMPRRAGRAGPAQPATARRGLEPAGEGSTLSLSSLSPKAAVAVQEAALKQNITTLHNRVNELGVAEPVIQQQAWTASSQLPGVQDTAKAKDIIGRTATLELRMVDDSTEAMDAPAALAPCPLALSASSTAQRPHHRQAPGGLTGDSLSDAQPGFDENHQPAVHLTVDAKGGRIMKEVSRENVGKRMAILIFEKGRARL